eukprot:scaffold212831_cov21-Tisochrysis_lutea.AAC.1
MEVKPSASQPLLAASTRDPLIQGMSCMGWPQSIARYRMALIPNVLGAWLALVPCESMHWGLLHLRGITPHASKA